MNGTDLVVRGAADAAGSAVTVVVRDGTVADISPPTAEPSSSERLPELDATGLTVLPGLVDLQVNGAAGVDITAQPHRLWEVAAALPAYGVTAFAPTVVTAASTTRAAALRALRDGPPPEWVGALPVGLHLEGPVLSPARRGAHADRWLARAADVQDEGWSRAAGVAIVTLAPELPGALELCRELVARGVVVSVGHTEATAAEVEAAIAAGARCVTHLGNAMPAPLAREPGPVGAALGSDDLVAGVIADGHHLHPLSVRSYWRALGPARFLAVSDTTAALGLPDGPTRLGEQDVVLRGGAVRLADGTLAGSAASLAQCVAVLRETTGCPLAPAVGAATAVPARLLGDRSRGTLAPGARGDLVLVDARSGTGRDGLRVVATVVGGRLVHDGRT